MSRLLEASAQLLRLRLVHLLLAGVERVDEPGQDLAQRHVVRRAPRPERGQLLLRNGAADIFLEIVMQPFLGFDDIVPDSSSPATV